MPSSHSSTFAWTNPSPHDALLHQSVHAPVSELFVPSSHSSLPSSTKPSPHLAALHAVVQAPVSLLFVPSSHSSSLLTTPSPHTGMLPLAPLPVELLPPSLHPAAHVPANAMTSDPRSPTLETFEAYRFIVARYGTVLSPWQSQPGRTMTDTPQFALLSRGWRHGTIVAETLVTFVRPATSIGEAALPLTRACRNLPPVA